MALNVTIEIDVVEDLTGLDAVKSALDSFNQSVTAGFKQSKSALDGLSSSGLTVIGQLFQQHQQSAEAYGSQIASLYDRTVSGAKSASDSLKNIWSDLANWWKSQIFDQITAWMTGQGGTSSMAAPGSAAGFVAGPAGLGGIVATLLGTGGFLPTGGASNLAGQDMSLQNVLSQASILTNGPLGVAGGGAGAATVASASAGNIAIAYGLPATTTTGTVLSKVPGMLGFSGNPLLMGGLGLEAISTGIQNPVLRGLSGAAGGALIGSQIGSIIPGIGTAIGAGVGALIGGIASLFGGGGNSDKNHDSALENQTFAKMNQTLQDFYQFRTTYDTAKSEITNDWNQMVSQFKRKDSEANQFPYYQAILTALDNVQNQRAARQQLQGMMAVPEFAVGGMVSGANGGMVAVVHPGEFVMSKQAVDRIGNSVLAGMNSGVSSSAQTAQSGTVVTVDPASQDWFNNALEHGLPVILRRGGPASRALRG